MDIELKLWLHRITNHITSFPMSFNSNNEALQKANLGALLVLIKDIYDCLSTNTKIFTDVPSFFSVTYGINYYYFLQDN